MPAIEVSNHALLRWLERTGAMDIEQMRAWLAASLDRAASAAARIEATRYLIVADGMVYVVEDGTVITVLDDDGRHHARILDRPVAGHD